MHPPLHALNPQLLHLEASTLAVLGASFQKCSVHRQANIKPSFSSTHFSATCFSHLVIYFGDPYIPVHRELSLSF